MEIEISENMITSIEVNLLRLRSSFLEIQKNVAPFATGNFLL